MVRCFSLCAGSIDRSTHVHAVQATVYIYELIDDEVKVDKVEFSKDN